MNPSPRLALFTLVWPLLLAACPENEPVPTGPVCPSGCLSSQECVADDRCACKEGFRDCDKLAENGCEVAGEVCPEECKPVSDIAFCANSGKNCDRYTAEDNCGSIRTVDCGDCIATATCGGSGKQNVCGQPAACEDDATFCLRYGKECGSFTDLDDCDQQRTADCGGCTAPETCGGGGNSNQCGKPPCETDAAFCVRLGKDCGRFTGTDDCDQQREVDCGGCTEPESCGGGGVANVCGQAGACESDAEFCQRNGKDCGTYSDTDNCNEAREAQCGTCDEPLTCGGGGVENECGCTGIDELDFCMENFVDCGSKDFVDECGVTRTAWCGVCSGTGWGCVENACVPQGIGEDQNCIFDGQALTCAGNMICISNGASGADKVGVCKRKCTATSQCNAGETCTLGQFGKPLEGICGKPASEGEACASLFGNPNFCWEADEPAGASLDCLGSVCRYICSFDVPPGNTPPSLPCPTGESCGSAQTVYPEYPMWIQVCEAGAACTPESDAEFCARLFVDCGEWSGLDNCENGRVVADCGVCEFGDCIGGTCM